MCYITSFAEEAEVDEEADVGAIVDEIATDSDVCQPYLIVQKLYHICVHITKHEWLYTINIRMTWAMKSCTVIWSMMTSVKTKTSHNQQP